MANQAKALPESIRNWIDRRPANWDDDQWYKDVQSAPVGVDSFSDRELGVKFMNRLEEECQEDGPEWGAVVQVLLPMVENMGVEDVTAIGRSVRKHIFISREKGSK